MLILCRLSAKKEVCVLLKYILMRTLSLLSTMELLRDDDDKKTSRFSVKRTSLLSKKFSFVYNSSFFAGMYDQCF